MAWMRILEVITVPFFAPRGTAFSALHRTRAFASMGCTVEVLAYSLGDDIDLPNVRIHRIPRLPGIRSLRMGPSAAKAILDLFLAAKTAWWLLARGPWDLIHVHEEAAIWAALLRPFHRAPVLYDMHSSLVEQLSNFHHPGARVFGAAMAWCERLSLRNAQGVIVICPELARLVAERGNGVPCELIENLPATWDLPQPAASTTDALRRELGLEGGPLVVYTGSFGRNQGIEEAIEAMAEVRRRFSPARLVLVGGSEADIERVRAFARDRGLTAGVCFTGSRPAGEMPAIMSVADVLLSPRTAGTNTPLKIYSYLQAGRPIVATDLRTHRQVLDESCAVLVEPTARGLADGILRVLDHPDQARLLGAAARRLAEERFAFEPYVDRVRHIVERTRDAPWNRR